MTVETIEAPGLAERVEAGDIDTPETLALLHRYLGGLTATAADVLALGCTHYAFLRGVIEAMVGDGIAVIEPSAAVAQQVRRVIDARRLRNPRTAAGSVTYVTSGSAAAFTAVRERLRAAGADISEVASVAPERGAREESKT